MKEQKFWDMRVTYKPNNADWYVALYGKNLVDDRGVGTWAASSALQGGAQFGTYTDPRTWGLAFGTDF
ncbi:MAG: putative TonB-dependent receptor [SAR86 cluster bacterium SAR86B]|uniref:Putative TonB-dependent receptor n=1 Tax=SAR86 cluster bacterium SAR86B TaxID=1123867 RepID=J4V2R2_9GAMM|nr:MAG: putative TonB-dependent receptor [SAR86 cluster bacterium SAR86B]